MRIREKSAKALLSNRLKITSPNNTLLKTILAAIENQKA